MAVLARTQFSVTDQAGNAVAGAWVEVRFELTVGQPLAVLYSDRAGTVPIGNPFQADSNGFAFFHVTGGVYRLRSYLGPSGAPTFEQIADYVAIGTIDELDYSTDTTLGGGSASDGLLPTQLAVKTYVDAIVAVQDAMVFKGVIDCSSNPNYPAADRGWTYRVSVAGKIGGASGTNVEIGDLLICMTDGTASGTQAAVGAQWEIVQGNLDGAVIGPASATSGNIATFNGTSGKLIQDGGKALPTGTIVGTSDTQTLSNKTISGNSSAFLLDNQFTLEDHATGTKLAQFSLSSLTSSRTFTLPDASDTIAVLVLAQTMQNKALDNTCQAILKRNKFTLQDDTDTTKQLVFALSGITTNNTRTLTVPDASGTLALLASPTFTGVPAVPTAANGTNTTQAASTAFVQNAVVAATTGVASIAANTGAFTLGYGLTNATNDIRVSLSYLTNALGADVSMTSANTDFDGPSVAQGTSGDWIAFGHVQLLATVADVAIVKLWDGTTVIASTEVRLEITTGKTVALHGVISSPAGNIRMTCQANNTTTKITFNTSGRSKDSVVTAVRVKP